MAAGAGIEPALAGPKPAVLPLDDPAKGRIGELQFFRVIRRLGNESMRRTEIIRASPGASGLLMKMMHFAHEEARNVSKGASQLSHS